MGSTALITLIVVGIVLGICYIVFCIRGIWKMFDFAGFPGWLSLVPILNIAILLKMAKMSPKWIFASFLIIPIPFIYIVWLFKICYAFEKDNTYVFFSLFFGSITIPLIGYGEKKYKFD